MNEHGLNTETEVNLDALAMVRLGQALRSLRLETNQSTGEIAPKLMAARTQIEGIEMGELNAFYSPSYFLKLFERYAKLLGLSDEAIGGMVAELKGEVPIEQPASESPASEPSASEPSASEPSASEPSSAEVISLDAARPEVSLLEEDQAARALASETRSGANWFMLLILGLVTVIAIWWFVDQPPHLPAVTGTAEVLPTPTAESTKVAVTESSPSSEPEVSPASTASAANPVTQSPATVSAAPVAAPAPAPTPAPASGNASSGSNSADGPAPLTLRFNERGWYWVRKSDNSVAEVGVAAGQTVRFDEMPVYLVLSRPATIEVVSNGKKVDLRRNEEGRDVGRYSRTMLERGSSTPPEPTQSTASTEATQSAETSN